MKKSDKIKAWVLDYLSEHKTASVVDSEFQDLFYEAWGGNRILYLYRAQPVDKAQRYLRIMFKERLLIRNTCGIPNAEVGMPRWVWVYEISATGVPNAYITEEVRNE